MDSVQCRPAAGSVDARAARRAWRCVATALALLPLVSGCATFLHSSDAPKRGRNATQWVQVTSEPEGARVIYRGEVVGVTPMRAAVVRRDERAVIRFEADGYHPTEVTLVRQTNGAVAGNLGWAAVAFVPRSGFADPIPTGARMAMAVMTPLLFALVDFQSGHAYRLTDRAHAVLTPRSGALAVPINRR